MFRAYLLRGVTAGAVAGVAYGAYVALVGNPLVAHAETYEVADHGGGPAVSAAVTAIASVGGGVLFGVLLGAAVFGVAFYFLEPAIPGSGPTRSYLLAAAGFTTVSGAPWLVLPPRPPGVEQTLPTDVRLTWYVVMMIAGAIACGLAAATYNRLRDSRGRWLAVLGGLSPVALVLLVAAVAPSGSAVGPIPPAQARAFQAAVVAGQVGLWLVLGATHAWLLRREEATGGDDRAAEGPADSTAAG